MVDNHASLSGFCPWVSGGYQPQFPEYRALTITYTSGMDEGDKPVIGKKNGHLTGKVAQYVS